MNDDSLNSPVELRPDTWPLGVALVGWCLSFALPMGRNGGVGIWGWELLFGPVMMALYYGPCILLIGLLFVPAWIANVFFWIAVSKSSRPRAAYVWSIPACVLALTWIPEERLVHRNPGIHPDSTYALHESDHMLGPAYWVWLTSIVVLMISCRRRARDLSD